jgi:hypothetical protein
MLHINFPVVLLSALIPLLLGVVWYSPKVFGNLWMQVAGVGPEKPGPAQMTKTLILCVLLSIPLAFVLQFLVIHQFHFYSMLANNPDLMVEGSEVRAFYNSTMQRYGMEFRTFKHGAFHGGFSGLLLALPIIGINSLFERKSWKYVAIHTGYWMLCLGLMGGVICAFPGA